MATPAYNAAWRNRGGYGHRGGFGGRGRTWGIATGNGSMLGGNTPQYLGAGQPTSEDDGELIGDGTPVYRTPPSKAAATPPSTTPSGPTAPQPATVAAPQPATVTAPPSTTTAIVVPRS